MLGTWKDPATDVKNQLKSEEPVGETETTPKEDQTDPTPAISHSSSMCGVSIAF